MAPGHAATGSFEVTLDLPGQPVFLLGRLLGGQDRVETYVKNKPKKHPEGLRRSLPFPGSPLVAQDGNRALKPTSTRIPRLVAWSTLLGKFVSVQLAAQAMTIVAGILLVRTLSGKEYAYFTIANSMQATMNVLADTGMSIGLSAIGGKVWQDPYRFGQLISTAMRLRRSLALIAAVLVTPIFLWMLVRNGSPYTYAIYLVLLIYAALSYQLSTGVLVNVPRLRAQISQLQMLDLVSAGMRLAVLAIAYLLLLNAATAIIATVVSFVVQYLLLRRWTTSGIERHAPESKEYRSQILGFVRSQAPNSIFFCLQSQITIWLISVFGNSQGIAEVGALSRLGIIFSLTGAVMASIIVPRFARSQEPRMLRRRYFQVVGSFSIFGMCLWAISVCFPGALVWVLGSKYSHLKAIVPLMVLGAVLTSLSGVMLSLNLAKGWVRYYWINIPCIICVQALLIVYLDMGKTHDVVLFGAISTCPGILVSAAITWMCLFRSNLKSEA